MSRHHRRLLRRLRAAWGDGTRPRLSRLHGRWWVECDGCVLGCAPRRRIALQHALAAVREELRDDAAATIARDGVVAAAGALGVHRDTLRTWRAGWLAPRDGDAGE